MMEFYIMKLDGGGYIASVGAEIPVPLFASTTVDECLKYIREQLEPPVVNQYFATPAMWKTDGVGRLHLVEPDQFGGH
jgi:hypothetical protein